MSGDDRFLDLPAQCRIENFPEMGRQPNFADVRIAWNDSGICFQASVTGKEELPQSNMGRPKTSDGVQLWIDTRDTRNIHRASKFCHHFWFLPTGGGPHGDDPACGQLKINRAKQDAPLCRPEQITFLSSHTSHGYMIEAFLPASVLNGFDPETNTRLGFFYWIRDTELGEQTLSIGSDFPFWEDPSLWATLELT